MDRKRAGEGEENRRKTEEEGGRQIGNGGRGEERERENKLEWPAVSWQNAKKRASIVCGCAHLACHISACLLCL